MRAVVIRKVAKRKVEKFYAIYGEDLSAI